MQAVRTAKHKSYEDFACIARDLVDRGVTTTEQLGADGGSAGGLLIGVMLTRYPELFGALVAIAPLFDLLRYHRLLTGPAHIAEFGDPDDPAERGFLEEYSPLSQCRGRSSLSADLDHDIVVRRSPSSRTCAEDGRSARGCWP